MTATIHRIGRATPPSLDPLMNLVAEDMNSVNGTFLNGQKVTGPTAVPNGAVVQFTNLTTGFRGVAFVNDPVPAAVGFGPVLSEVAGLLPCFVIAGVTMS